MRECGICMALKSSTKRSGLATRFKFNAQRPKEEHPSCFWFRFRSPCCSCVLGVHGSAALVHSVWCASTSVCGLCVCVVCAALELSFIVCVGMVWCARCVRCPSLFGTCHQQRKQKQQERHERQDGRKGKYDENREHTSDSSFLAFFVCGFATSTNGHPRDRSFVPCCVALRTLFCTRVPDVSHRAKLKT